MQNLFKEIQSTTTAVLRKVGAVEKKRPDEGSVTATSPEGAADPKVANPKSDEVPVSKATDTSASAVAPSSTIAAAPPAKCTVNSAAKDGKAAVTKPIKPPRCELVDREWFVENYVKHKDVVEIKETQIKQSVRIRENDDVTIRLHGKVNSIVIESCKNTRIVVDNVIASIELIHCKKGALQILSMCQSIVMDHCSGLHIHLSKDCKDAISIVASMSTETNVHFPTDKLDDEGDVVWQEAPIPEQFVHRIKPGADTIISEVSDLYR